MLTPKELDDATNFIYRNKCVWDNHFYTQCSGSSKVRWCGKWKSHPAFIQHICSKHIKPYKNKFPLIEVITLSKKDLFYLQINANN